MKKVIALALSMVMALSMTAMAAETMNQAGAPGDPTPGSDNRLYPGETYKFDFDGWTDNKNDLTKDNIKVSVDWDKGSAMVESFKLKDGQMVLELKENYTIDELKDLVGTVTVTGKNTIQDVIAEDEEKYFTIAAEVANEVEDIDGASKRDDAEAIEVADNTIYNVTTSGWFDFGGDGERLSSVLVRLPEDKQVFAYWNEDPIEDVEDKYYDLDADIEYVNFVAKPNLGRNAEIAIQGDYSDQYHLYEYVGGELEPIDADWNEDDGLFEFTASRLGSYVISDKELVAEADEPAEDDEPAADDTTTQNPDTGANDVVGVAVALAAVSLVAAGAVSLKK